MPRWRGHGPITAHGTGGLLLTVGALPWWAPTQRMIVYGTLATHALADGSVPPRLQG